MFQKANFSFYDNERTNTKILGSEKDNDLDQIAKLDAALSVQKIISVRRQILS